MSSSGELAYLVKVSFGFLVVPVVAVIGVIYSGKTSSQPPAAATVKPTQSVILDPLARALAAIPEGPGRASIHRGYEIVSKTFETLPDNVGHEHDVRGVARDVRSAGSHRDPDGRRRESGGVVDSIANHRNGAVQRQ